MTRRILAGQTSGQLFLGYTTDVVKSRATNTLLRQDLAEAKAWLMSRGVFRWLGRGTRKRHAPR